MGKKAKLFVFSGISFLAGASIIGSVAAYASINKKNEIRVSEYNKFLEEKTNLNSFDNWENDKKISSIKSNTLSEVEKIDKNSDLFTIQKARKIVNESIENIKNIIASHKKMLLEKEKAFIQYNNVKKQLQDMLLKIFDFLNKESQEHYYIGDGNEKIINKQNWLLKEINENQKYFSNITIDSDIDSIELATTKLVEIKFLINDKQEAYKFAKEYNDLLKEIKQFISDWYELLKDPDIKKHEGPYGYNTPETLFVYFLFKYKNDDKKIFTKFKNYAQEMYDKTALLEEFDIDFFGFKIKDKNFYKNYVELLTPYKKAIDLWKNYYDSYSIGLKEVEEIIWDKLYINGYTIFFKPKKIYALQNQPELDKELTETTDDYKFKLMLISKENTIEHNKLIENFKNYCDDLMNRSKKLKNDNQ